MSESRADSRYLSGLALAESRMNDRIEALRDQRLRVQRLAAGLTDETTPRNIRLLVGILSDMERDATLIDAYREVIGEEPQ